MGIVSGVEIMPIGKVLDVYGRLYVACVANGTGVASMRLTALKAGRGLRLLFRNISPWLRFCPSAIYQQRTDAPRI